MSAPPPPHDTGHRPGPNTRAVPALDERPTAICYDTDVAAPAAVTALSFPGPTTAEVAA
ncbi:hypothetical protein [Promicromonospora sukumoe]|uniref:Uncharacterized protein n=1 Tax=Promicromonospora sukumoe TaxID=88382 RepID=A0A7W3J698_9MICO|nr:hypothetical protein [Promicromonospora sukumoe]MBA8807077.1 hypothetical protein [Promicromonospora sukumoe]